jgi:hypothetical protein
VRAFNLASKQLLNTTVVKESGPSTDASEPQH